MCFKCNHAASEVRALGEGAITLGVHVLAVARHASPVLFFKESKLGSKSFTHVLFLVATRTV